MKIALITPTKDRPDDIRKMLASYLGQSRLPDQVIIVDASSESVSAVVEEFPDLKIDYKRWTKAPSAAGQRNGGIELLRDDIDLVCFFDDDQVLHEWAIERMLKFWECESSEVRKCGSVEVRKCVSSKVSECEGNFELPNSRICEFRPLGAASFFDASWNDLRPTGLKKSKLSEKLGLYTSRPGGVAPSGWQSLYYGVVDGRNLDVEWMSSQAIVLKRSVLDEFEFDEFFEGYSYLEDLDFSYSVSRKYRMTVVAAAKFDHFHSAGGRGTQSDFGRIEVRNRRYIVKKHGLSMASFRLGMFIRFFMSVASWQFSRARGNLSAFFEKNFHDRNK